MSIRRRAVVPLVASLLAAAPALAQPGAEEPAPAPQPPPPDGGTVVVIQPEPGQGPQSQQPPVRAVVAPMNEDWNNVSHINGHPVPVGERDDYLIAYKKTNIASNPIGWMFGFYGLSVSQAVSSNFAIRGDVSFYDLDGVDGYEVGVTVPIYFKRVYQGPFLEGGLLVRNIHDSDDTMPTASVGPQVMFGWHWTFDSGANVALAVGAFRAMGNDKSDDSSGDDVEPAGYFRVGYAF